MGNSFTFALEPKRMIMEKYLVNPNDSDAFSSEVMHKVVLNGIDFELPEHIWDAISILLLVLSLTGYKRKILSFRQIRL